MLRAYETTMTASLLLGVPSNVTGLLGRAEDIVAPKYIRRAVDFMRASLQADVVLEDIAQASGCSPRNLQLTFRRLVGSTPMRHLRTLRLEEARRRLGTQSASLASIATSLGYTNLGRFARDYRIMFGEAPSRSLRALRAAAKDLAKD
ncbi:MAG: helix-turn-helix transcriptional regulator [Beijerinckiaceae bacterium]